jgi:hypothetical protein
MRLGAFCPGLIFDPISADSLQAKLQISAPDPAWAWQRGLAAGQLCPRWWWDHVELDLFRALVRIAAHDYRGKQMGVTGILGEWKEVWPDPLTGQDDLALVSDALHQASDALCPLEWLSGRHSGDGFGWDAQALDRRWSYIVPRLFPVPSQVRWKGAHAPAGAGCSIGLTMFWMGSLAMALGEIKEPGKLLELGASFEHGAEIGDVLVVRFDSGESWARLVGEPGAAKERVQRWLSLAALAGARVEGADGGAIRLVLPLVDAVHCQPSLDFRSEQAVATDGQQHRTHDIPEILRSLATHALGVRQVWLPSAAEGGRGVRDQLAALWSGVEWFVKE